MAEYWFQSGGKRRGMIRVIAILCACLMIFAVTLQLAHSHPAAQGAEHCQICLAIHAPLPSSSAITQLYLGFAGDAPSLPPPAIPRLEGVSSLSDRAPPVLA